MCKKIVIVTSFLLLCQIHKGLNSLGSRWQSSLLLNSHRVAEEVSQEGNNKLCDFAFFSLLSSCRCYLCIWTSAQEFAQRWKSTFMLCRRVFLLPESNFKCCTSSEEQSWPMERCAIYRWFSVRHDLLCLLGTWGDERKLGDCREQQQLSAHNQISWKIAYVTLLSRLPIPIYARPHHTSHVS